MNKVVLEVNSQFSGYAKCNIGTNGTDSHGQTWQAAGREMPMIFAFVVANCVLRYGDFIDCAGVDEYLGKVITFGEYPG